MSSARIVYTSHQGITPEHARDARARAWAFVFHCWQEKGSPVTAPDDAEESKNDRTATASIQKD